MAANIPVSINYKDAGFKRVEADAKKLDRQLKQQSRERLRAIRLQERHEKAVTSELKAQIRDQRRLNSLTKRLNRDLEKQQRIRKERGARIGTAALGVTGGIAAAGAVAARATIDLARESVELSREQAAAEAQLSAALESTGHAAGVSAGELKAMASELQSVTNFGDEATLRGQAMLLTFTQIGRDVFPEATRTMLDMSTALDQDLRTSAVQLGKALNDPVKGLDNLSRAGVQFTEQQKDQIKSMAEAGRVADAQRAILKELETQFGGSAEAAREADANFTAAANAIGDLKEIIGEQLTPGVSQFNEFVVEASENLGGFISKISDTNRAIEQVQDETGSEGLLGKALTSFGLVGPGAGLLAQLGQVGVVTHTLIEGADDMLTYATKQEEVAEALANLDDTEAVTGAAPPDLFTVDEEQLDADAEQLEKLTDLRRDFARSLIDIDEQSTDDSAAAWDDFFSSQQKNWKDYNDSIGDIQESGAADLKKIQSDLQKDLKKTDIDENKKIVELKRRAEKEDKQGRKRKQIDALSDERLFNFELKQLAAQGAANQIQEALERREIEEQISREKAQVEKDIEDENLRDDVQRVRDAAQGRREELRTDAAEETAIRQERLQAELAEEEENYLERFEMLRQHREDKLAEIEASREEAIAALGQELAEAGDLTERELNELTPVAGQLGENAGKAFADGLNRGFEINQRIEEMLGPLANATGTAPGAAAPRRTLTAANAGLGSNPGSLLGFQHGGAFTVGGSGGPDSQLVQFMASPGEEVSVGGGPNVTINATGPGVDQLVAILERKVSEGLQEYTNTVLAEALR